MRSLFRFLVLLTALAAVLVQPAFGQNRGIGLVRDAEIENIIRDYATPIFNAAGLDAGAVIIHLVNDPRLNAFVAGGQRMFINTGLLMNCATPKPSRSSPWSSAPRRESPRATGGWPVR